MNISTRIRSAVLAGLLVTAVSVTALASSNGPGTVTMVQVTNTAVGYFQLSTNHTPPPGCPIHQKWAVNLNTEGGRQIFTAINSAYLSGRKITVVGTGACASFATDTEEVLYITGTP